MDAGLLGRTGPWVERSHNLKIMSKRYQLIRERVRTPSGGLIEAFRMALVEFSCLGEQRFELDGYPYDF